MQFTNSGCAVQQWNGKTSQGCDPVGDLESVSTLTLQAITGQCGAHKTSISMFSACSLIRVTGETDTSVAKVCVRL